MPTLGTVAQVDSEPAVVVEAGYDQIADRHLAWIDQIEGDPRLKYLEQLITRLPEQPGLLDLGCGAGVPCTARMAEVGDVVGVDISERQLDLARSRVPTARFVKADMASVTFPAESFDAVAAFYSIPHTPRDGHGQLFERIADWLRPGGHLLASLGSSDLAGTVEDWLGAPMFFSSHAPHINSQLVEAAGFTVQVDELVAMREPEGEATFQWIIASKVETRSPSR